MNNYSQRWWSYHQPKRSHFNIKGNAFPVDDSLHKTIAMPWQAMKWSFICCGIKRLYALRDAIKTSSEKRIQFSVHIVQPIQTNLKSDHIARQPTVWKDEEERMEAKETSGRKSVRVERRKEVKPDQAFVRLLARSITLRSCKLQLMVGYQSRWTGGERDRKKSPVRCRIKNSRTSCTESRAGRSLSEFFQGLKKYAFNNFYKIMTKLDAGVVKVIF